MIIVPVNFSCKINFFFQAEDGIRDGHVTGVQTCALPISLVVDDRKEARRRDRERASRERAEAQQALMTGDESKMPLQHRGRERRLVRDLVDSRRNVAEYFFPIALIFMLVALVMPLIRPNLYMAMSTGMIIVLWGGIALCVIDSLVLRRRLRAQLNEEYGEAGRGLVGYGIMRAIQIRRFRLPRAQIKHGESPRRWAATHVPDDGGRPARRGPPSVGLGVIRRRCSSCPRTSAAPACHRSPSRETPAWHRPRPPCAAEA